jgi:heat-inducible transcriptional repressor
MDEILSEASKLASSFTDYMGIAFKSGAGKVRINRFDSVHLSPRDFLLVMMFSGDIVKAKTIHLSFPLSADELRRFTEALNLYLVNLESDAITMPIIVKLEGIMGSLGAMVHPTVKVIYETMSELDTADIKLDGVTNLLQYPEYSDTAKFRNLLGVLEEKDKILDVISAHTTTEDGINVYIGNEDSSDAMKDTTLIFKNVTVGGKQLAVGVIGPKRMNYQKVIGMLNRLATGLDRMVDEDNLLNEPFKENGGRNGK